MTELKDEDKIEGNVTWEDLKKREYWDIQYYKHDLKIGVRPNGRVQTRQEYSREACLKIIDGILQAVNEYPKLKEELELIKINKTMEAPYKHRTRNILEESENQKLKEIADRLRKRIIWLGQNMIDNPSGREWMKDELDTLQEILGEKQQ